jgi:hypothetical protein
VRWRPRRRGGRAEAMREAQCAVGRRRSGSTALAALPFYFCANLF